MSAPNDSVGIGTRPQEIRTHGVTVRKGPRLTHKSNKNPYYIELSNTYSPSRALGQSESKTPNHKHRNHLQNQSRRKAPREYEQPENIYIIRTRDNDAAIINTAIELSDDERKVMNKPTICQRSQLGKAFSTETHKRNNSITRDGKHVQFKIKPSIATYQQHDNTPMLTYDSGADEHYLIKKDRTKLSLPILRISYKKV